MFFKDVCTNADEQNSVGTVACRFSLVLPSAPAWALQPSGWSPQLSTKSWATPWVRVSGCTLAKGVGELGSKWQHSMRPKPTNHNNAMAKAGGWEWCWHFLSLGRRDWRCGNVTVMVEVCRTLALHREVCYDRKNQRKTRTSSGNLCYYHFDVKKWVNEYDIYIHII